MIFRGVLSLFFKYKLLMVSNIFIRFDPSVFDSSLTRERFLYVFLALGLGVMPFFYFVKPSISGWLSSKIAVILIPG